MSYEVDTSSLAVTLGLDDKRLGAVARELGLELTKVVW
jgi:hypothetical protein